MATPYQNLYAGVDPGSTRSGADAWSALQQQTGPLNADQQQQAMQLTGYADPTGAAALSGDQYNTLLKEAARLTGGSFTPYAAPAAAPTAPAGPAQPGPYAAPPLNLERQSAPAPFAYQGFTAPQASDLYNDPGYQARQTDSRKAIEATAAARGILRTGGTAYDVGAQADRLAANEYGNLYDRKFGEWNAGRQAAGEAYDRNFNADQSVFGNNRDAAIAEYTAAARGGELNFDRDWQRYLYGSDDAYRRTRDASNDQYRNTYFDWQKSTNNRDFDWSQQVYNTDMAESRRRFLAQLGLA